MLAGSINLFIKSESSSGQPRGQRDTRGYSLISVLDKTEVATASGNQLNYRSSLKENDCQRPANFYLPDPGSRLC